MEICPDDGSRLLELSSEDRQDPLIGTLFDGRFRIFHKLGEGGMGAVYSARRLDFDSEVALKLLKVDFARDEGIRKRFLYEARTISNLQHPHSVRLYDFGQTADGHFYMVMELLRGESLADRLAYRFVSYREIFATIPPICGVLDEAHSHEVIHRDLKPENIFLQQVDGNHEFPKLLDFGIAKHHGIATMTQSGTLWGTPAYMSPEQARGDEIGPRADIYGIGVILYELISGNLPFHATTQMGFAVKQINEPARSLLTIPGLRSVPPELDAFVLQLLAKDPEDRPASMEEVASRLLAIREQCFDEALLDCVPAEEVDPVGLKDWLHSADKSQSFPVAGAVTPVQERRASTSVPTLSFAPVLDEVEGRQAFAQTIQSHQVVVPERARGETPVEVPEEPSAVRRRPRFWLGLGAVSGIAAMVAVGSFLSAGFHGPKSEDTDFSEQQLEHVGGMGLGADSAAIANTAISHAIQIIAGSRSVVRDIQAEQQDEDAAKLIGEEPQFIIVDEPPPSEPAQPAAEKTQKKSASPKTQKKGNALKEALENTF